MTTRSQNRRFHLPIIESETRKKRGFLTLPADRDGLQLSWDVNKWLGQNVIKDHSYFYVVSTDCSCVDPLDKQGKVKLGYSSAQSTNNGYAERLANWQRVWGTKSIKIHMLVLFHNRYLAEQFESQTKDRLENLVENGANIQQVDDGEPYIHKNPWKHEWFRLRDLSVVLASATHVYQQRKNNANVGQSLQPSGSLKIIKKTGKIPSSTEIQNRINRLDGISVSEAQRTKFMIRGVLRLYTPVDMAYDQNSGYITVA